MPKPKPLTAKQRDELLNVIQTRFEENPNRHKGINWANVESKLKAQGSKLAALHAMEQTGGEPDVVDYDKKTKEYVFFDCSEQSPSGRRSLCYDDAALKARKANKPKGSAVAMANDIGIELLTESQYAHLQTLGTFDTKTSSWLQTPDDVRSLGGAIAASIRFGRVFVSPNGAESYYAARGFRGALKA